VIRRSTAIDKRDRHTVVQFDGSRSGPASPAKAASAPGTGAVAHNLFERLTSALRHFKRASDSQAASANAAVVAAAQPARGGASLVAGQSPSMEGPAVEAESLDSAHRLPKGRSRSLEVHRVGGVRAAAAADSSVNGGGPGADAANRVRKRHRDA
jgi:hypothetical protein